ncbi:MAG: hypothetical protein ACOZNI_20405 [Myxococcota bacterium]
MWTVLLAGAALARPYYGVALGGGVLSSEAPGGTLVSYGPVVEVDLGWHAGPLQSWAGLTSAGLVAYTPDGVIPASVLAIEGGLGFGTRDFALGLYGAVGFPGGQVGLYGRWLAPTDGWLGRVGAEGRLFATDVGDAGGLALMLRVEPGQAREARPEPPRPPPPPPRRPPPPHARPYPPPAQPPPPPPPPEDEAEPPPEHHDDPYEDEPDEHHEDPYG